MKSLAQALVECAAFLELSGEDMIHPDAAVQAQESIVYFLRQASPEEKKALLCYCRESAAVIPENGSPGDKKRRDFFLGFGEAFGILDE